MSTTETDEIRYQIIDCHKSGMMETHRAGCAHITKMMRLQECAAETLHDSYAQTATEAQAELVAVFAESVGEDFWGSESGQWVKYFRIMDCAKEDKWVKYFSIMDSAKEDI